MVPDVVFPAGREQTEGALHVGTQEGLGISDGVVVVALGRVVDDGVVARDDPVEQRRAAYVARHELHAVLRQARDVGRVAGEGELVEHRHVNPEALYH